MQSFNFIHSFQTSLRSENLEDAALQAAGTSTLAFVTKSFRKLATVDSTIRPNKIGRIRFQGSWWNAICPADVTLQPGTAVQIIGRTGITFFVEPFSPIDEEQMSSPVRA